MFWESGGGGNAVSNVTALPKVHIDSQRLARWLFTPYFMIIDLIINNTVGNSNKLSTTAPVLPQSTTTTIAPSTRRSCSIHEKWKTWMKKWAALNWPGSSNLMDFIFDVFLFFTTVAAGSVCSIRYCYYYHHHHHYVLWFCFLVRFSMIAVQWLY